jgi:hypothetical protein
MLSPETSAPIMPQRFVRPLNVEPGHWNKQLPTKYLNLAKSGNLPGLEALLGEHPELLNAEDPNDPIYYVPVLSFAVADGHLDLDDSLIRRGAEVARYSAKRPRRFAARQRRRLRPGGW